MKTDRKSIFPTPNSHPNKITTGMLVAKHFPYSITRSRFKIAMKSSRETLSTWRVSRGARKATCNSSLYTRCAKLVVQGRNTSNRATCPRTWIATEETGFARRYTCFTRVVSRNALKIAGDAPFLTWCTTSKALRLPRSGELAWRKFPGSNCRVRHNPRVRASVGVSDTGTRCLRSHGLRDRTP